MLKEVLIVEGKMDVGAINRAVEADCIITNGFHFNKTTLANIAAAYKKRGIIILRTCPKYGWQNINCAENNFARSSIDIEQDIFRLVEEMLLS